MTYSWHLLTGAEWQRTKRYKAPSWTGSPETPSLTALGALLDHPNE